MGKGRLPGPYRQATLSMRTPSLKTVDATIVKDSEQPMMVRLDSRKLLIGLGTDVDVYVPKEPAGTDKETPSSLRPDRDAVGRQLVYKLEKPVLSLDLKSGILTGTSVLSIPDSNYPENLKGPLELPVQIKITLPQSDKDLEHLSAHIEACFNPFSEMPGHGVCVDANVEVHYDRNLLAKLIREVKDAGQNVDKAGASADSLLQVAVDVEDLVSHVVPELGKSLLIEASGHGPWTRFHVEASPFQNYLDFNMRGFNLIPKGAIFDYSVPAWGYSGRRHLGKNTTLSWTGGLLAYPSLPSIFAGAHPTQMFPAYLYGELSAATEVSKGLQLGVRLTVAGDIWRLSHLEPPPAPESSIQQILDVKNNKSPTDGVPPWIMLQVEGRFDWLGGK